MKDGDKGIMNLIFNTREFRDALGGFATGVAVVTTKLENQSAIGLTINSFASLSLDPPLVLWSIDRRSDTLRTFEKSEHFTVNVLTSEQQEIAGHCSKPGDHAVTGFAHEIGDNDIPFLSNAKAVFECDVFDRVDGGDHIIMVGKVRHFSNTDAAPLLYYQGQYASLA